jgi:hypothetical protein
MKKMLLILVLINSVFGNDLVTQYRLKGINGVDKILDYQLGSKVYWKQVINQADIRCGYIESTTDNLTCDNNITKQTNLAKDDFVIILSSLYVWRYAWIYNDFDAYIKFYDDTFQGNNNMNIEEFKKYKSRIFAKKEKKDIKFSDIRIIPYMADKKNLYEITFKEEYKSNSATFSGTKKLIIQVDNNQSKILSEI